MAKPMQTNNFNNPIKLTDYLAWLVEASTSWEKENINISSLDRLIKNSMRLIVKQTENLETAPILQKSLYALSHRMKEEQKFNTPEGHLLAFEVTTIAMGIFSSSKHAEWAYLPQDALRLIFSKNLPQNVQNLKSGLEESKLVSKEWYENVEVVKKHWVNSENVSLRTYGCNTAEEAVQYIIDKGLLSANLGEFRDITDDNLIKLIENCPNLNHLVLESDEIKDFPLEKLTKLTTLKLPGCNEIPADKLLNAVKNFHQLVVLDLSRCEQLDNQIQADELAKRLKGLTQLTSLSLDFSQEDVNGMTLAEALKTLKQLTHLSLAFCSIQGNDLAEVVKNLSQLSKLDLIGCNQIPGNKLAEVFENSKLTHLCLAYWRMITMDELADGLKNLLDLTYLDLSECELIGGERLSELLRNLTKLNFLGLSGCCRIGENDDDLPESLKSLSELTSLNLADCKRISENMLINILKNLPQLTCLNLSGCEQIEGIGLVESLKNLSQLTKLNLSKCQKISQESLADMLEHLTQLTIVNLSNCNQVSQDTLNQWEKQYPKIKIIST